MADLLHHVIQTADRAGQLAIDALDGAISAAVKYGPGLAAETGRAAAGVVAGAEEIGREFADNVSSAITSNSPDTAHFGNLLAGLNLNLGGVTHDSAGEASLGELSAQLPQMAQLREKGGMSMNA